jgi:predicted RNase H-like HicB family nuclease
MKRHYTLLLERDPNGGPYNVTVPMLPGCATQGDTVAEAVQHADEAIRAHVLGMQPDGEEPPEEDSVFQLEQVEVELPVVAVPK